MSFHQRPKDFARSEEYAKFHIAIDQLLDSFDHIDDRVKMIAFLKEAWKQSKKAVDKVRSDDLLVVT